MHEGLALVLTTNDEITVFETKAQQFSRIASIPLDMAPSLQEWLERHGYKRWISFAGDDSVSGLYSMQGNETPL